MGLLEELKRRNVIRVGIAYVVVAWLLLQLADIVLNNVAAPRWVFYAVLLLLGIGFVLVVVFSWVFELTPEGLKRESEVDRSQSITPQTGRKLDRLIMALLVLALAYFVIDKFVLTPSREAKLVAAAEQAGVQESAAAQAAQETETTAQAEHSIAVLPFVNMSSDPEQDYFSDGLSEELLNLLAKIPQLRVAARTSSFTFKDQNLEIPEIGERLHVANVLEGSVRKSGNQVRITAQLVRADNGYHLWSETYDRTLDNIFAIQDEIAAAVVEQLKIKLLGAVPVVQETNSEAYNFFLQARALGNQTTANSLEMSNALYREALEKDPGFAAAWAGLANNMLFQATFGESRTADLIESSREAVRKSIELDPDNAEAWAVKGDAALLFEQDFAGAAGDLERALALEPGNVAVLVIALDLLRSLGRFDEAIQVAERTTRLDPLNPQVHYSLGLMHRYAGHLDASLAALRTAVGLSPERISVHAGIGETLMLKGEPAAALEEVEQENSIWREIDLPMVYFALGRKADSDAALADLIREHDRDAPYNIAYILAYRGEVDAAFEWLDKAVEYKDPGLTDLPFDVLFANLHSDPRWAPLLERLGKSPAQLAAVKFDVKLPE